MYAEPTRELREKLNLTKNQVLRLMGSVYGLRSAPRHWYLRVKRDLTNQGWRRHQLDQCVFLYYEGEELIGLIGVYVDDFLIAGVEKDPRWQRIKKDMIALYNWGKWHKGSFELCGVEYKQLPNFSIRMTQGKYTRSLTRANFSIPAGLHKIPEKQKLDAKGLKCLRGINGSMQWLVSNTRIDLAARVS